MADFQYGAIFDMDGVLVDNSEYHTLAFERWSAEMGLAFDREDFIRHVFGKQNRDIFRLMLGRKVTEDEAREWGDRKEAIYRELYRPHVREVPGLTAFLRDLAASGFGIAVATSGPPENARMTLEMLGVEEMFSAVVTSAEISRGKPDPRVFLVAAERLAVPPSVCAVFEDSPPGAAAANAAGMTLIGVSTNHNQLPNAARMIESFTEINAEEVITLMHRKP